MREGKGGGREPASPSTSPQQKVKKRLEKGSALKGLKRRFGEKRKGELMVLEDMKINLWCSREAR